MSEFAFELELCATLESQREGIVARQLGTNVVTPGGRIVDIVCVEPGPAFEARLELTPEAIPSRAIASRVGTGRARYWKECFDCHPKTARRVADRALEIGFFERERHNGREYVRQVARYPDWYDRLLGIENKPDLGRPGDLETQLQTDVSLAVLDAVVLATESYVTRAHLNRIPEAVGVWRVHRHGSTDRQNRGAEIEVVREPTPLSTDTAGIELLESHPGRTDIAVVGSTAKARARTRIAERAYGKGWRTYAFPACRRCTPASVCGATLPQCSYLERVVDASTDCGPDCPGYESAAPAAVSLTAERDRETPWVADPVGKRRQQSGLDRFS